MLKDKFKELTFDLLRCVIKKDVDPVNLQKRDCILTSVCLHEGDTEKVQRILQRDWVQNFERASVEKIQDP